MGRLIDYFIFIAISIRNQVELSRRLSPISQCDFLMQCQVNPRGSVFYKAVVVWPLKISTRNECFEFFWRATNPRTRGLQNIKLFRWIKLKISAYIADSEWLQSYFIECFSLSKMDAFLNQIFFLFSWFRTTCLGSSFPIYLLSVISLQRKCSTPC